jgi:hypothetical protein
LITNCTYLSTSLTGIERFARIPPFLGRRDPMAAEEEMTLGEFVKFLAALLTENSTPMLFKEEAPWHLVLYRLYAEEFDKKPQFLTHLKFDWGGPFPKCKELSRYLQFLHSTACVGTMNPSYEEMVLKEDLEKLWFSEFQKIEAPQQKFIGHAAELAAKEFALVA